MSTIDDLYKVDIDFNPTATGDFDTISGVKNVEKSLERRLLTVPGSLVHKPGYGVGVKLYLNDINKLSTKRKLALAIQEQFVLDERVEKVLGVSISTDQSNTSMVNIIVRVQLVGLGEQSFTYQVGDLP